MTPLLCVAGARGVGKTSVAVALVSLLQQHLGRVIAWKPLDVNGIGYQIQDSDSDGERLHRATNMSEHINLLNPYLLNEDLPPLLAAQRDGVKVDEKVLSQRLELLRRRSDAVLMESLAELLSLWTAKHSGLELLQQWQARILWVSGIGRESLEQTLQAVTLLQQAGISCQLLLNNTTNELNADLLQYQWMMLEERLDLRVLGLLPYRTEENRRNAKWLSDNLETTFLDQLLPPPVSPTV
ncbi:MAG: ATP-dependent dethiobiotin synthetase BioD [Proteobacteria bacterium]|jgi:dethiobiotin synthase|nr:ATP-dependent dethiobiotin synthetase BioD [Pseudomonadota bacterium]